MTSIGFKRAKHTMTLLLATVIHYQKERWSHGKLANMTLPSCLGGTVSMTDLLLLRNLLHIKKAWYSGAEIQGPHLQNIWGCQCLLFPHGYIVLQGQERYLPPLILMEIAASLQVAVAENSFFHLTGFLHSAIL